MTIAPLLVAVDFEGSEQFVIVMFDVSAGSFKHSSGALSEQDASAFFIENGETPPDIQRRFQVARDNKGLI